MTTKDNCFSEREIDQVTSPPSEDAELEEIEAVTIEQVTQTPTEIDSPGTSQRLQMVLESLLFVTPVPLTIDQLSETIGVDGALIQEAIAELGTRFCKGSSGIVLYEVAGGWQFRTDTGSAEYVRRYLQVKPQRLTRAGVETLAIVAYRQPVTRPEIEDIRGVDCGGVVKALLERKLIKIVGKKEEVGRPILYGTTREFLEYFALKDLSALPTLREFQELTQDHQQVVEDHLPPPPKVLSTEDFKNSEAALEELETAIANADAHTKASSATLDGTNGA